MNKKIYLLFIPILFLITGCSIERLDTNDYDKILDRVTQKQNYRKNDNYQGYSLYVPYGLRNILIAENNLILKDKNNNDYYIYVDVVSYYHKIKRKNSYNYHNYYYKDFTDKSDKNMGYLVILEKNDKYFVHAEYNYVKIEVYGDKDSLSDILINVSQILGSIKYNDDVLKTTIGDKQLSYKEESFNIFTNKKVTTNYLDYIEKYDNGAPSDKVKEQTSDDEIIDVEINED